MLVVAQRYDVLTGRAEGWAPEGARPLNRKTFGAPPLTFAGVCTAKRIAARLLIDRSSSVVRILAWVIESFERPNSLRGSSRRPGALT